MVADVRDLRLIRNQQVFGSNPTGGSKTFRQMRRFLGQEVGAHCTERTEYTQNILPQAVFPGHLAPPEAYSQHLHTRAIRWLLRQQAHACLSWTPQGGPYLGDTLPVHLLSPKNSFLAPVIASPVTSRAWTG